MDPKLLLIQLTTLLFKESQLEDSGYRSSDLVKQILAKIKLPEATLEFDRSRDILQSLRSTALWMADSPKDHKFDRMTLLQRIRVNVGEDESLYYAFEQGTEDVESAEKLKSQCISMRHELRRYLQQTEVRAVLKEASSKVLFDHENIDWRNFVSDTMAKLEPLVSSSDGVTIEGLVDEVDMSDSESLADIMMRGQKELSTEGSFRTPWQAVNRMFGEAAGPRRGDTIVVGALQHNYKSGFTNGIFKGACIYSMPSLRDPNKKPLNVLISLENNMPDTILWFYANLKENETGQPVNLQEIDPQEASNYVTEKLTANGFHVKMLRLNPSDVTYHSLTDLLTSLEAEGYEIHMLAIDYLNMMSKRGCTPGPHGYEIRDLYRRIRNFTNSRGITLITPHQLSTEAKGLVRQGVEDFVKEIANKGYYDSCKTIDQEVDMEIYIHIVIINGRSYLTIQRGKHRKPTITPMQYLYTVLPFESVGGIRDDIHGLDTSMKHPGGRSVGEGGGDEKPWWQTGKSESELPT